MNTPSDADFAALADAARKLGYTTPEQVINRLERIIQRNNNYVNYRQRKGRQTSHDEITSEDSVVLALAIQFLQGGNHDESH